VRYSDGEIANRDGWDFGWEMSSRRRFPRHDNTPYSMYTSAAKVWDFVQGPFSVAPRQPLALRFVTFASLYAQ
jgi:hypothetical protein